MTRDAAFTAKDGAVERVVQGLDASETSFAEFYDTHRDEVVRALTFTVGSLSLAEEAADEAMARAYQKWSEVSGYANPSGWVYRVGPVSYTHLTLPTKA